MNRYITIIVVALLSSFSAAAQEVPLDTVAGWLSQESDYTPSVAWGDVDGDGDLDLACGNGLNRQNTLYLNNNGVLETSASWLSQKSDSTRSVAWGDVDGDGDLDLACANERLNRIYLNNNGVLETSAGWSSQDSVRTFGVAWGDVDGDGDLDLACGNYGKPNTLYLNNNGVLETSAGWLSQESRHTCSVAWGDVDGDGDLDLACGNSAYPGEQNTIYLNNNGTLETSASWLSQESDYTHSVAWGDVDGDGDLDLACGNSDQQNKIYLNNNGALEISASWLSQESDYTNSVAWGDVDGDGDLDLACGNIGDQQNRIYLSNNGALETSASWVSQESHWTYSMAWGDVDGDGDLDLACGNYRENAIYLNKNDILETSANWWSQESDETRSVAWGDADGDGDLDLACGNWGQNTIYLNNNGVLETSAGWLSQELDSTRSVAWGDVDGDGDLDLACGDQWGQNTIYLNNNGVLETSASWVSQESDGTNSVAWGDVDGDGDLDLACGNSEQNTIYLNNNGVLETSADWRSQEGFPSYSVVWGDVDGDGDLDLACGNMYWERFPERNTIYLNNNGVLETSAGWLSQEKHFTYSVAWGDVDGDGDLDLACGSEQNTIYLNNDGFLQTSASWFSQETERTQSVAWGDIDGDGDLDLACGNSGYPGGPQNTIYLNNNGVLETSAGWFSEESDTTYSLAWGDVDGDGDLDLACGNSGQNTITLNTRIRTCDQTRRMPNTPTCLANLMFVLSDSATMQYSLTFDLIDLERDPASLALEYSELGGGQWEKATLIGDGLRLETSPQGVTHEIIWDANTDGVDGYDVWIRLGVSSNPDQAGLIQWPSQWYQIRVGRVDGRPRISLLYPWQNSVVVDSLPLYGRIWDLTNFDAVRFSLSPLPDTTTWNELAHWSTPIPKTSEIAGFNVSGFTPGEYVLRIEAADKSGKSRILDRQITLTLRTETTPRVLRRFPPRDADNIPRESPVVVKFDQPMNQDALTTGTFEVRRETGKVEGNVLYDFSSRTLVFDPAGLLDSAAFHYFIIDGAFPSQSGNKLMGDFASSFHTSRDTPAEEIVSITPLRGETNWSVDSAISVTYTYLSEYQFIGVFSLDGDTVLVDTLETGINVTSLIDIPGVLPKTFYLIRISDDPGLEGTGDFVSYFITEDTDMPVVVDYTPPDNAWLVGVDDEIVVNFNKPLNTFSIDSYSFYLTGPGGRVSGLFDFSIDTATIISFTPDHSLQPNTEYEVTLTSHIQDNVGNPIDSMSWRFTTGLFDTVRYEGGTMTSGDLTLSFPYGTLESDAEIGIGAIPAGKVLFGPDLTFTMIAYDIEPAMDLHREAFLSIRLPDSTIAEYGGLNQLKIYRYDTLAGDWEYLGGSADGDCVSLLIDRLGRYGVFESTGGEVVSEFVSSLTVIPRVISPRRGDVNSTLAVSYSISQPIEVVAKIYDTGGRLVTTLVSGPTSSIGENLMQWDGRRDDGSYATDGLYILVVEAGGQRAQKTFVILNK